MNPPLGGISSGFLWFVCVCACAFGESGVSVVRNSGDEEFSRPMTMSCSVIGLPPALHDDMQRYAYLVGRTDIVLGWIYVVHKNLIHITSVCVHVSHFE